MGSRALDFGYGTLLRIGLLARYCVVVYIPVWYFIYLFWHYNHHEALAAYLS